ncbi:tetraacyldisaccharide 4'-kinase [Aureimonas psammosilenae]|uniref:tetraacyldisaccharide 4'-kinase n=1 Tax=Aureimonas psammosilenae TaxID=2495496 RepID=UPI001F2F8134|nr:tetraacyldisaccharide 4'-kinase [Aureimonas psammosilenae]
MAGETPAFWWRSDAGWPARCLFPAAALYGAVSRWRMDRGARVETGLPVICVGNFTVGGGGKTPTCLALAKAALAQGLRPGFVSRGHGGATRSAVLVDPEHHHAGLVGDEPMLLAHQAPTAVAVNRGEAAALLRAEGVDFIIMDDGFQSARLAVDFALLVVDAGRGIGNGRVLPAGPLRAPLIDQVRHADALLVVGKGAAGDEAIRRTARGGKPVFEAHLQAREPERLHGVPLFAFAGIADPAKFYRTLADLGLSVAGTRDFPDHHVFSGEEIAELKEAAARGGARLVTTAKDAARLRASRLGAEFLENTEVLEVDLVFEPHDLGRRFVRETLAAHRRRRSR